MKKAIIIVLDSLGIGCASDADYYNDKGSNTLGHIAEKFKLNIPNLTKLGMIKALEASCKNSYGLDSSVKPIASYGFAEEVSKGKDTVSGHWEIAGSPVLKEWGYFYSLNDSFPKKLLDSVVNKANLKGFLGNCHASGTEIIQKLGEEHIKTGFPIFYTSADSVFQIACNEETFGLENLYRLCEIVRKEVDSYNIGRVIARPFVGTNSSSFIRTYNRKDYAVPPFEETLLDIAQKENINVVAIGKTADIFAYRGVTSYLKTPWNEGSINDTIKASKECTKHTLIFTNLSDFDVLYGHRRDPKGYGEAINYFDKRLPEILDTLNEEDLLIITADHGNDPTWIGTDHTRENIPILIYKHNIKPNFLGKRATFSDIGQTVATYLNITPLKYGLSIL